MYGILATDDVTMLQHFVYVQSDVVQKVTGNGVKSLSSLKRQCRAHNETSDTANVNTSRSPFTKSIAQKWCSLTRLLNLHPLEA